MSNTKKVKVPFHTAVRGFATAKFGGKGGLSAASVAAGRPERWLSSALATKGFHGSTVEAIYGVLPELRAAVLSGAVASPPRIKRPGRRKAMQVATTPPPSLFQQVVDKFGAEGTERLLRALVD
jgi:hypothetical protein